ncbi:MAG: hypothetical protein U0401_00585 [Anaerolineae bacterium]
MTKRSYRPSGNRRRLPITILLFLFFLIITATPTLAQDPTSTATPPRFDPRFGIVDSFVNTAEANAAGAGWTRVFFRWDVVQPGGPSDWKPTNVPDPLLEAEIASGREVVAVLIGTPTWATESGTSTAVPPLEYWGDFVYKIASQYQGRIKHWVIWNQPDVSDPASPNYTWAGTVEDYYRLLKEAYQKIKGVDPAMQVHLAGLTYTFDRDRNQPQYLARLLEVIQADPEAAGQNYYFDGASYHLYYNPRQIFEALTEIHSILDAHGVGNKPIWLNETNAPPSDDYLEPLAAPAATSVTLEEQSAYVVQAFALALAGGAERVAFNKLRNDNPHPESVEPYGLLRADNSRRPAFAAFQTVATYFANTQKASWLQEGEVTIVTLARGDETTTVLWNTNPTATFFPLKAIAAEAKLIDAQGTEQPLTPTDAVYIVGLPGALCSGGPSACFIGGAPQIIVEAGSAEQRPPLLPLVATATPVPQPAVEIEASPTDALTATMLAVATSLPPPTLTPTPLPTTGLAAQGQVATTGSESPSRGNLAPAPLPAPGQAKPALLDDSSPAASVETPAPAVPPVTVATVLRPERLFWLFIIGLLVFMVSYGIQVVIWYRLRR